MSWFEDLTPYTYLRSEPTDPPTLNVGWLARDHAFSVGEVPSTFVARLEELCAHATTQQTRGLHPCELCPGTIPSHDRSRQSSNEIRAVGANGTRYAAPRLVLHYVTDHNYAPPKVFIDAVLRVDLPWRYALAMNLCMSCGYQLERRRRDLGIVALDELFCPTCAVEYPR